MSDKDCLACRLVSGFGVVGMGYYIYHHSRNHSKNSRLILSGVSLSNNHFLKFYINFLLNFINFSVVGAVGVARLLDVYPFGKDRG